MLSSGSKSFDLSDNPSGFCLYDPWAPTLIFGFAVRITIILVERITFNVVLIKRNSGTSLPSLYQRCAFASFSVYRSLSIRWTNTHSFAVDGWETFFFLQSDNSRSGRTSSFSSSLSFFFCIFWLLSSQRWRRKNDEPLFFLVYRPCCDYHHQLNNKKKEKSKNGYSWFFLSTPPSPFSVTATVVYSFFFFVRRVVYSLRIYIFQDISSTLPRLSIETNVSKQLWGRTILFIIVLTNEYGEERKETRKRFDKEKIDRFDTSFSVFPTEARIAASSLSSIKYLYRRPKKEVIFSSVTNWISQFKLFVSVNLVFIIFSCPILISVNLKIIWNGIKSRWIFDSNQQRERNGSVRQ